MAQNDRKPAATAYMVNDQYLKGRRRHVTFVLLLAWLVGQGSLWAWYSSLEVKPSPWTSVVLMDLVCSVIIVLAVLGGFTMSRRMCVLLTETHMVVNMYGIGGTKALAMSREHPLVIKKDASGGHWIVTPGNTSSKRIRLPYMAFPELDQWAMAMAQDTVKLEGRTA